MKSVLISIQPKWCELIASGKKTIEVRKTAPKEVPFKCYIYETKFVNHCRGCEFYLFDCSGLGKAFDVCTYGDKPRITTLASRCWQDKYSGGKVIGEFVCDKIDFDYPEVFGTFNGNEPSETVEYLKKAYLSLDELQAYCGYHKAFLWYISDLKIYDKPQELCEFKKVGFMTENEWLYNLYPNTHCSYTAWAKRFEITKPPQSWQYVEELTSKDGEE